MGDKSTSIKAYKKNEREKKVLFGVIHIYINTAKPVGSNSLKEQEFEDLSSATIRNYFAKLEEEGYLTQQHTSGGRIPTEKAFRLYAAESAHHSTVDESIQAIIAQTDFSTQKIGTSLQEIVTQFSELIHYPVFISSPRFDHDFVTEIKLVTLDNTRCLAVVMTHFGKVQTEQIILEKKPSIIFIKKIESYFAHKLKCQKLDQDLDEEELRIARTLYNEIMVRYVIGYSHFSQEELYRFGFSQLLHHPEFAQVTALANGLGIFENVQALNQIVQKTIHSGTSQFFIGHDLDPIIPHSEHCAILTEPYKINQTIVGTIGIVGPLRMNYPQLFGSLKALSEHLTKALTQSMHRFKIDFRRPRPENLYLEKAECQLIEQIDSE